MAQSTYLQVLSCEGVQFSGDLSRQTIILSNRLLAFHLGTNLLAAQITQFVPVVCLKTNCSEKDGDSIHALLSDLVSFASHILYRKSKRSHWKGVACETSSLGV